MTSTEEGLPSATGCLGPDRAGWTAFARHRPACQISVRTDRPRYKRLADPPRLEQCAQARAFRRMFHRSGGNEAKLRAHEAIFSPR
jgi:hypothetical protein